MLSEYTIDQHNIIIEINEGFQAFGEQNGGITFNPQSWLGHDLLKVVYGDTLRMYYHVLFRRIRLTEKEIELPYRCDSPTEARFMRMKLSCGKAQDIHFVNSTEAVIPFERPISINFRSKDVIKRCIVCNRLEIRMVWTDPLDLYRLPLDFDVDWNITYALCPTCQHTVQSKYLP